MTKYLLLLLTVGCVALFCLIDAAKPGKQAKPGKIKNNKKYGIFAAKKDIIKIRAELDEMKKQCGVNNVHFFFHGAGDEVDHHGYDEDDVRVHVDMHLDDKHRGGIQGDGDNHDHVHSAHCQFKDGHARITQRVPHDKFASIKMSFSELSVDVFNVHVHENGDLSNGCKGLGGHYDPIDSNRDVGDIGSIRPEYDDIRAGVWFNDTKLTLIGQHSILGRSIIGHDGDGNIVTCCVIGRAADDHDHDDDHENHENHGHDHVGHRHDHESHGHDHESHGHDHESHGHDH